MKRVIGIIAAGTITAASIVAVSPATQAVPAPLGAATASTSKAADTNPRKPEWKCKDKLANWLYEGGFTGYPHKMAWAITMRESRGQILQPGHSQFNGHDWGIWQINEPTWGGQKWFTYDNMTDPVKQTKIAWKYLTKKGTYWRPWGLTADGQLDATHYSMWSSWQHENWIMAPFRTFMGQYPCKTTPPSKK